jgi:hypothetical protein
VSSILPSHATRRDRFEHRARDASAADLDMNFARRIVDDQALLSASNGLAAQGATD